MSVVVGRDESVYRDALAEVQSILELATLEHGEGMEFDLPGNADPTREGGVCIRCATPIPYNPRAPYCPRCYDVWAAYRNWEYAETTCHRCGTPTLSTRRRPLCSDCFADTS
jgi:hypothetical protein